MVAFWCNTAAGVLGIIAAVLWFWSGAIHVPAPAVAFGGVVAADAVFVSALKRVATLNKRAATVTAISVLFTAAGNLAARWGS